MIYRHEFFNLNNDLQIAYSINNTELHIVGEAYVLLLALCEKGSMFMEDVKELLGIDKNYEGRRIREDIEKINHAVGKEIITMTEIEDEFDEKTVVSLRGGENIIKEN